MKKPFSLHHFLVFFLAIILFQACAVQNAGEELSFIVTCDMRGYTAEPYRLTEYTLGGFEAIKQVGQGSFMVITGDLDPPHSTRELMNMVLGNDYPWYPVVGNHDFEKAADVEYLRDLNKGERSLPRLVRKGPPASEETTYSFDWNDAHFVVLNLYYDGKSDTGTHGNVVPELLRWLENDLEQNRKKHIFVFGHEPLLSIPDMDNGAIRHQGDALDQYPDNAFKLHQLLLTYGVAAYITGHTHSTSIAKINGLWQLDAGHIRGYEADYTPANLFARMSKELEEGKTAGKSQNKVISELYASDKKEVNKILYALGYGSGASYKDLKDTEALKGLSDFYNGYAKGGEIAEQFQRTFWENCGWTKSSFLKITVGKASIQVDVYRDNEFNGQYVLKHSQILN